MSKWDELEKAAKASTPGRVYDRLDSAGGGIKYHCYGSDKSIVLQVDHKNGEFGFIGPRGEEDEAFFLACTPEAVLSLIEQNRELAQRLREALNQMIMAAESIGEGRYDEALLHCGSLHRPKIEAIRKATGEEE